MISEIDNCILRLTLDSRMHADLFWEEQMSRFDSGDPGLMGLRVRCKNGSMEVSYFKNGYTVNSSRNEKSRFMAKHVRRTGRHRYNASDLKFAKKWERDLAMEHEAFHGRNRQLFLHLANARKALRQVSKLIQKETE